MKHDSKLSLVQVKTLDALIKKDLTVLNSRIAIETCAKNVVSVAIHDFSKIYNFTEYPLYIAYALAKTATKAIKLKTLPVLDYIQIVAEQKQDGEKNAQGLYKDNDFGAFGDLYEIIVKCSLVKNVNLIKARQLTVRELDDYDVVTKKYGKIEIGQNGKTLSQGNAIDYLDGDYKAIIYGVFDEMTKEQIYSACLKKDLQTAIKIVKAYSAIFANKYDFYKLQDLRRGKIITIKSGKVMIQYNEQFYKMFIDALETDYIVSLETI